LERLITDRGKILSSRISGNCAKHQRRIAAAIKRARFIALLPYVKT
jgi:small subunit ribosomal protein S18